MTADPRTFVLIGDFQDNITPALEGINRSIAGLKRTMSTMTSKRGGGFSDVTQSVGKLVSAQKHLKDAIKGVGDAAKDATQELREYKTVMGKVASAHYHIQKSGTAASKSQAQFWQGANTSLSTYATNLRKLNQAGRRIPSTIAATRGSRRSGGGELQGPVSPPMSAGSRRMSGGGRGGGGGANFHMAEFAFAFQVGNAISQPITNAIVAGFNIGTQMMMKPFQYVAGAFGERVQDELSDLKAAGGLFSISKRSKNPFLANIDEAIQFQQDTNETFAKMAAALPGVTNDYVQVGKRLSDTAARIVMSDFEGARQEANRIRGTAEGAKFYGGQITGTGAEQQREVISTLLGELTKKSTIAGLGGTSRAGGIAGAYGLPGLVERMISQEQVSMGQFQRYASVFSDPTIADALQRNIEKINATQLNSVDRYKALNKLLDEVVTPELIEKLRISVDGITQGFKATFFDPDTGLFGLGRNFKDFGRKLNAYGQYVNKAGEVVDDINDAAREDLSLFEILRDIFSNLGQVLLPIAEALPLVFDPLKKVASILMDARHYAAEFNRTFNEYREGLKILSEQQGKGFLKESLDIRASLATLNGFLLEFGGITRTDFDKYANMLKSEDLNIGKVLSEMVNSFMKSDMAGNIGELIGSVIGTVLTMVAQVTGLIAKTVEPNKLTEGLTKGFKDAGGEEALGAIFDNVFKALLDVIVKVFDLIPAKGKALILAAALAPALISATVLGLTSWLANIISATLTGKTAAQCARKIGAQQMCGGSIGKGMGGLFETSTGRRVTAYRRLQQRRFANWTKSQYTSPVGPLPSGSFNKIKGSGSRMPYLGAGLTLPAKAGKGLTNLSKFLAPVGKLAKIGKAVPGGALLFGGVDAGLRMAAGEDAGRAIGGAASSVVGSTLGAILGQALIPVPGLGAAVGGIAGGIIGDKVFNSLSPSAREQNSAAQMQLEASRLQMEAARKRIVESTGVDLGPVTKGVTDPFKLVEVLKSMGLQDTSFGESLTELASTARFASDQQKLAADALNAKIQELMKSGFSRDQIAKLDVYRKLQEDLNEKNKLLKDSSEKLKTEFDKLPEGLRLMLAKGLNNMTVGQLQAQRVATVNSIQIGSGGITFSPLGLPKPKTGTPTLLNPGALLPNPKSGLPEWMNPNKAVSQAKGSPGRGFSNLYAAAAYESRMKPSGSDLLIANSSETVIPAAGGYGMREFIQTIYSGFVTIEREINKMVKEYANQQQKQESTLQSINQTLKTNQQQTNTRLQQLETKFSTPSVPGLGGGSVGGGVDSFTGMAASHGLQLTSGYRPGDPGWHGANRARDYSNGTGPTPQMLAFAQALARQYGSSLKELIYTPLGFSIKNGQIVPPYAKGSHYNHVHVAYAFGSGNPAFFSSQSAAEAWEKKNMPSGARTITGNTTEVAGLLDGLFGRKPKKLKPDEKPTLNELGTSTGYKLLERRKEMERQMKLLRGGTSYMSPEGMYNTASAGRSGGGEVSVNAPITINQQPGQDAEELASIVAMKIGEAVADARASSIFV